MLNSDLNITKSNSERYALGIEYSGANYFGWQRQTDKVTIQAALEYAISKVVDASVTIKVAGRTDRGVHALNQVIHFDTSVTRPIQALVKGVNSYLPQDIKVLWAQKVANDFDARKSAIARRYVYVIYNNPLRPAVLDGKVGWFYQKLDVKLMQTAANYLLGEKDFSCFRAANCQAKSPIKKVRRVKVTRQGDFIYIDIIANAFLYHMVRNITGSLVWVGMQKESPNWVFKLLQTKQRKNAAQTASAAGLYLTNVFYPKKYKLPGFSKLMNLNIYKS